MKNLTAFMLSIVLLFSCICSAEACNIDLDLKRLGHQLFTGAVQTGCDDDGCLVISAVDAILMGKPVSLLLQINDEGFTVVYGEEAYTFTYAALEEAGWISGETAAVNDTAEQYTEPAYEEDFSQTRVTLMNKANHIASIAAQHGIVDITAEGDLIFSADIDAILTISAGYLNRLAGDETIIPALAASQLWMEYGLPDAASVQAFLARVALNLSAADGTELGISGEIWIKISADGSLAFRFIYNSGRKAVGVSGNYSANTFKLSADIAEKGATGSFNCVIAPGYVNIHSANTKAICSYEYRVSDDGVPAVSYSLEGVNTDDKMNMDIAVIDAVLSHTDGYVLSAEEIRKLPRVIIRNIF